MIFQDDVSSQKRTNEFNFTTMRLVSFCFLEEIEDTKKTFRNYLTFNSQKIFRSQFSIKYFIYLIYLISFNKTHPRIIRSILIILCFSGPGSYQGKYGINQIKRKLGQLLSFITWIFFFTLVATQRDLGACIFQASGEF